MRMAAGAIRVGLCMGVLRDHGVVIDEGAGCLRREFKGQDDKASGGLLCQRMIINIRVAP